MKIQINKDLLTEYKDTIWKGFTAGELAALLCGGAVSVGVVAFLHHYFGMYPATAIYAAVPFALPPVLIGFFKYQGYLPVLELLKEMLFTRACRTLIWDTEEDEACPVFFMKIHPEGIKQKGKKKHGIYDQSRKAVS